MLAMKSQHAILAVAASVAGIFFGQTASGEDVVTDTSASRLWSTVTDSSVVLPVPWPKGAATAVLVVPASGLFSGVEANLTKGVDSSYVLALPRPAGPDSEYVVSPAIEFRNADGETLALRLEASFGVVCDSAFFSGTDTAASSWTSIKKGSYALPKPDDEASFQVEYGSSVATNAIPESCAWTAFTPRKSGTYSLSLYGEDGELSFSAILNALGNGFILSFR